MNLSLQEKELAVEIGFDEGILLTLKQEAQAKIIRLNLEVTVYRNHLLASNSISELLPKYYICYLDKEEKIIVQGLSFVLPEPNSVELVLTLGPRLAVQGYLIFIVEFIYELREIEMESQTNVVINPRLKHEKTEIGVFKGRDQVDAVRIQQTNGISQGILTKDIIDKHNYWESICCFEIIGAGQNWIILDFVLLPKHVKTFAADVYEFCPNTVDRAIINQEKPLNEQTPDDLAEYLKTERDLLLWWT